MNWALKSDWIQKSILQRGKQEERHGVWSGVLGEGGNNIGFVGRAGWQ